MISDRTPHPLAGDWSTAKAGCRPPSLREVRVEGFLGRRMKANRHSILAGLESPIPRRFQALARGEQPGPETERLASDSDLYKWIEGASYALAYRLDEPLRAAAEEMVGLVLALQAPDGYLNTQVPPYERLDTRVNHDLYQAGHLCEAAVAYHRATGDGRLLEAAGRWIDWLLARYEEGHPYFSQVGEHEHPEIELGLLRLAREAGEPRYRRFAEAILSMHRITPRVADLVAGAGDRHAVRVGYLLTAAAESCLEGGDAVSPDTLQAVWEDLSSTRLYVTGGLGCREQIPARPYDLPQTYEENPDRDIAETCASVAMMMFTWRMHALAPRAHYMDTIETILYNHYLGALSLDNLANFYYNPLRVVGDQSWRTDHGGSRGRRTRLPEIHSTACCLPNAWRFFGALPEYLYSLDDTGVWVNLYTSSTLATALPSGAPVGLRVETDYPHDGRVAVSVTGEAPSAYSLRLRVPGWCRRAVLTDPDGRETVSPGGEYVALARTWRPGDRVTLEMEMPVRAIVSAPEIAANAGQAALGRGPLVYCLEGVDAEYPIERLALPVSPREAAAGARVEWAPDLLGGVHRLGVTLGVLPSAAEAGPYIEAPERLPETWAWLVPFYARANRSDEARWTVFLPRG